MKKLLLQLLGQKVYAKAERWKKKIFPTQFDMEQRRAYDAQLVAFALAWYVDYSNQPEMFITREDPRVSYRLKRA